MTADKPVVEGLTVDYAVVSEVRVVVVREPGADIVVEQGCMDTCYPCQDDEGMPFLVGKEVEVL